MDDKKWQEELLQQCRRKEDREVMGFVLKNYDIILVWCKFVSVHLRDVYITDGKVQFEGRKLEISEK